MKPLFLLVIAFLLVVPVWASAGEWKPSKKGISLNDETVKEIITALSKADPELEKQADKRYAK
jgi:hypothetical protein